jgi:hypothetical protein
MRFWPPPRTKVAQVTARFKVAGRRDSGFFGVVVAELQRAVAAEQRYEHLKRAPLPHWLATALCLLASRNASSRNSMH